MYQEKIILNSDIITIVYIFIYLMIFNDIFIFVISKKNFSTYNKRIHHIFSFFFNTKEFLPTRSFIFKN